MKIHTLFGSLAIVASTISCGAQAATGWQESTQGDLSNNGLEPSVVPVSTGSNIVTGTTGNPGTGIDRDYFTFTVPVGQQLSKIILAPDTSVSGGASFFAMQAGPQLTVSPTGAGVQNLIGFLHYTSDQFGTDILPLVHAGGPLGSGTYAAWIQELGGSVNYSFDFQLLRAPQPVPVAVGPLAPLCVVLTLLANRRPSRRRPASES